MRICIVHRDLHKVTRGGLCTVYRNLADQLVGRGHGVVLITQETPHPLAPVPGIEVVTLPRTEDLAAHRRSVADAVTRVAPDVVEASTWEAELLDYARRAPAERVPVLARADLSAHTMGARELAKAEQAFVDAADLVAAVSVWTAGDIEKAYGVRPYVLLNGVDRERFHPGQRNSVLRSGQVLRLDSRGETTQVADLAGSVADTDALWRRIAFESASERPPVRLLWVGKMTAMKGFDRLQEIVRALRGRAAFTILLGHGWVEYDVTIDGEPHVQFLRDLDEEDVPRLYRSADYILSTSRWEGFHLSTAEGLASGIPALLPREQGTAAELLTDGVTGALYGTPDDLRRLLDVASGLRGALPERFDWSVNAEETLRLYAGMVAGHCGARGDR